MIINYLAILAFLLLGCLAAGRGARLHKRGINAFVFGVTDKTDFLLMPIVLFFLYTIIAIAFNLPLPSWLRNRFFEVPVLRWIGLGICFCSHIWFAITLKSFGKSFRIGIDEKSPDKLVTSGMFALSRNPIYVAFLTFFAGMLLIHPNVAISAVFLAFGLAIHRQILREEKFLKVHYGKEYENYCKAVRRYL